ncbi:MAG: hypothetical protein J6V06_07175 [Clostridia bacterium]|nr:hypothetical protein [Clostridia bacterium]MBO7319781.1 hypothetical protein [Clostridia bacterium]
MKKNFKKALSLVLAVLMAMAVVPFSGMATNEECEHDYEYYPGRPGKHSYYCEICGDEGIDTCARESEEAVTCGSPAICDFCYAEFITVAHVFDAEESKVESAETLVPGEVDCDEFVDFYLTCSECGDVSDTETFTSTTTKGNVHDFTKDDKEYLKEAVCEGNPVYYYACSRCNVSSEDFTGATYTDEDVVVEHMFATPEEGPAEDEVPAVEATCTSLAKYYKVCVECGKSAKGIDETATYEAGEMLEHEYVANVGKEHLLVSATCSLGSVYSKSCKTCGVNQVTDFVYIEGEDTPPEGSVCNAFRTKDARRHSETKTTKEAKAPTCTTDGWTVEISCAFEDCKGADGKNTVVTASEKVEKLGHDYSKTLDKEYKAPTCKQYGQYGQVKCVREGCGKTFYINEKNEMMEVSNVLDFVFAIEPLGHEDKDGDMVCDRASCGGLLEPEDLCDCICHSSGFLYFIAWILKFFWQLTGTRPYCDCGVAHYAVD